MGRAGTALTTDSLYSLKTLTKRHAVALGGMAAAELGNRCSIRLSYGTVVSITYPGSALF